MNDFEILALYHSRDEAAIRESEAAYGSYCLAIAERITGSRQDAEECVADTWLSAWKSIPPAKPDVLRLYFARIVRNHALDRYRAAHAARRTPPGGMEEILEELDTLGGDDTVSAFEAAELQASIRRFLASLAERERSVFLRRYFYAESDGDIAARYGLRAGHVRLILSRTRKKLKKHLCEEGFYL